MDFTREDRNQSIAERFQAIVRNFPDQSAFEHDDIKLTYRELDVASNAFSSGLMSGTITPGDRVALILPSDISMVTAMLASLKTGLVFVPIDPDWPLERVANIIEDVQPSIIVARKSNMDEINSKLRTGECWRDYESLVSGHPADAVPINQKEFAPAVIYYTSGTTGRPKGIVINHRSLLNSTRNYVVQLSIGSLDRVAWTSSAAFGASTGPIFGALLTGAVLCRFDVALHGLAAMSEWLTARKITVLMASVSLFKNIASAFPDGANAPELRVIKIGGEPAHRNDAELFRRKFHQDCRLINGLGITEAAGNVCFYQLDATTPLPDGKMLPIGTAVDGLELHVVDEEGNKAVDGQIGQVVVVSEYLADGYWRSDELTSRSFIREADSNRVRYFTGDYAYRNNRGDLVYAGRDDGMVKIRGHRVMIAEVESAIAELADVRDVAVLIDNKGDSNRLVAYIKWREGRSMSLESLRCALSLQLTKYMMPALYYIVPSFPMLTSGKIDRVALSGSVGEPLRDGMHAEHRDSLEFQLLRIMEKATGAKGLGIHDDFFDLGGDSLSAARMLAQIERRLGISLPMAVLGNASTAAGLAEIVRSRNANVMGDALVMLDPGEDRYAPFFCAPGAGSDAYSLIHLARHVGRRHPFYALQYSGLDGVSDFQKTVEEMAMRFIHGMRRVQPRGPYFIGGSSFGGWIAFAAAQELTRQGEVVAVLALLDAYGIDYPSLRKGLSVNQKCRAAVRWLLPLGHKSEVSFMNLILGCREKFNLARIRMGYSPRPAGTFSSVKFKATCHQYYSINARKLYRSEPYPGVIDLFRAEIQPCPDLYEPKPDLGWEKLAAGGLRIQDTPGYHSAHIREPHVGVLAVRLLERIKEVEREINKSQSPDNTTHCLSISASSL
ncbi:MAG TPA: AMP-binding protein [Kiritimatiellia bacterium]|nr:AMP-binding protein [Kiritimatiellia bacterium]